MKLILEMRPFHALMMFVRSGGILGLIALVLCVSMTGKAAAALTNMLNGGQGGFAGEVVFVMTILAFGAVGFASVWRASEDIIWGAQARRRGVRTHATVVAVSDAGLRLGNLDQGRLGWREPDGQMGESLIRITWFLKSRFEPGDKIIVYRLGEHAFWEGDVGRRAADGPPKA